MRVSETVVRPRGGPLVGLALAYLAAATGIMVWRGISVSPDYLLLLLVPVALATGRAVRFMADWVPFIALFLGYEAMRGIAGQTGIAPHVSEVPSFESALFGGRLPTAWLQDAAGTLGVAGGIDVATTVVYFLHFAVPVGIGLALWLLDRSLFLRFVIALLGMSFAAFLVFLLAPTAPPWWAQDHGVATGFRHVMSTSLPSAVSPFYKSLDPNPTAAIPSLHAAFPLLGWLAVRGASRIAGRFMLGWTLLVWLSVVYLGEHYVVDVIAGAAFALASWWAVDVLLAPRLPALAPAIRPNETELAVAA